MNYYFITGTSSGIGKAIVEELLKFPNHKIIGLSRTNDLTDSQFQHFSIDLSNVRETATFNFADLSKAKKIVLINNAGTLGEIAYVGQQANQNIVDSISVNFTSAAILMNQFIKKYQDVACEKTIVNISSGAATSPYDGWANYCSAKAALSMFTQVISKEQQIQKYPIKAFAIAPGVVDTLMQDIIRQSSVEQFNQVGKFIDLKKNGKLYKAHEVAKKLVAMINNTDSIIEVISRINL